MRSAPLTVVKGGIDRMRPKGGARADSLYDLVNARLTIEHNIVPREGTVRIASLPAGTVGLTAFEDSLYVFASEDVDLSAYPQFTLTILLHPTSPDAVVTEIHFAEPFMGALYVVAEFDDGSIHHYWLQEPDGGTNGDGSWTADTEYSANEFVVPTVPNGFVYSATRLGSAYPAWTAGALRAIGDFCEPTVYNEYYYEVIAVTGDNPRSGEIEPTWPLATGATVVESTDGIIPPTTPDPTPPAPPPSNTPQVSGTRQRYYRNIPVRGV